MGDSLAMRFSFLAGGTDTDVMPPEIFKELLRTRPDQNRFIGSLPERSITGMAAKKKPKGWRKFDELAKGLAQIDKGKVDKKIARDKTKRIKKRKKK